MKRGENPERVQPLPQWQFHDFRRTVATNLAKIGIPVHVVERLMNHVTGTVSGIAAVYNRHSYLDEQRQALEAWSSRLDQIVSGNPANVVTLVAARKGRG
ncbi:MAG: tyrosine-type recombinase/integrase [Rhodospirillaceae bacterium]